MLRRHVDVACRLSEAPVPGDPMTWCCAAFAHGLVVQALSDPDHVPPQRRIALLDRFLADLFPRS